MFAASLAAIHLFGGRILSLDAIPRSRWLSLSGGSAVAYVFVHVLPGIQAASETIERAVGVLLRLEQHVYPIALLGFTTFCGLERFVEGGTERSGNGRE